MVSSWPKAARPIGQVRLHFDDIDPDIMSNLSAGTRIDDTLFVAADEYAAIESFTPIGDGSWGDHHRFDLADLFKLILPEAEADLEGLAAEDDWLWLTGSHARTRNKPEKAEDQTIDLDRLADLKDTRPRALLGRVPLVRRDGRWVPVARDGDRRAGILKQGKHGSVLARALKKDPLLAPFTRIPAKEGGVDIEGIAVCGDRVALGMRGPVVATHAVLVEFTVKAKKSGKLEIASPPHKRLLAMEGLGIRDLKRCGDDLLILAGPTTGLSGPCALYRWEGWAQDPPRDAHRVRLHRPTRIVDLPFGRGFDHPEGLALWGDDAILVICDSPSAKRLDESKRIFTADVYQTP